MNIAKSFLLVALNLTFNIQAAFADSPKTDIFNLNSNPQELKSDEIVNCVLSSSNREFKIDYKVMKYSECKLEISKIYNQIKSGIAKSCVSDVSISAKLMNRTQKDERGQVVIKCEKPVTTPVVELTIEQKLHLALKENAALRNHVVALKQSLDSKNKELEGERKSVETLKQANSKLNKQIGMIIVESRKSIEHMQQLMKSMQLKISKMMSERQQMKQQIAELLRKQTDRMPASVEPAKKIETPAQQVIKK